MILARTMVYVTLFVAFVLVFVPARVLEWSRLPRPGEMGPSQIAGATLVVVGGALVLWCVLVFAFVGKGTPAPFDPPRRLVVRGPYRFVRNPIYIGAAISMIGAALFYGSWPLIGYTAVLTLTFHLLVITYEEPTLQRTFGAEYEQYRRRVRRWLPSSPAPATP
jgi:protein-S-isoprenylcysteine O-methyltransferase Ste14